MKIAAVIIGCHQVSPEDYQTDRRVYVFDSSQSLDEIMQATGTKDVCALNLANVESAKEEGR